jgi:hypothetical protein
MEAVVLLPGARRADKTASEVWFGQAKTRGGAVVNLYFKVVPHQIFISECVCAALAREVTLPTPDSFAVLIYQHVLPNSVIWTKTALDHTVGFGTSTVSGTSVLKRFLGDQSTAWAMIKAWKRIGEVGAFDEWIANGDRHSDNLMLDGTGDFWLIDHSHALTGPNWTPASLQTNCWPKCDNQVLDRMLADSAGYRNQIRIQGQEVVKHSARALGVVPSLLTDSPVKAALDSFLGQRAKKLINLVSSRLKIPEIDL